jgi:hypothetical protein
MRPSDGEGTTCPLCFQTNGSPRHWVAADGRWRGYHIDCHSRKQHPCLICVEMLNDLHERGQYLNDNDREAEERKRLKTRLELTHVPMPKDLNGRPAWLEVNEFTSALRPEDHAWLRQQEIFLAEPKPIRAPVVKRNKKNAIDLVYAVVILLSGISLCTQYAEYGTINVLSIISMLLFGLSLYIRRKT